MAMMQSIQIVLRNKKVTGVPGREGGCGMVGGGVEKMQVVWAIARTVTFNLSEIGSHWRALKREVTRIDLHFTESLWLLNCREPSWVKGRSRERNEKANTADCRR